MHTDNCIHTNSMSESPVVTVEAPDLNVDSIQRLRWRNSRNMLQYWFSTAILNDEKVEDWIDIDTPISEWAANQLTSQGRRLVDTLVAAKGVFLVSCNAFSLRIKLAEIFTAADYHHSIVKLISSTLFDESVFLDASPIDNPPPIPFSQLL